MERFGKKKAYAIAVESARENFCTKHCNIIYQGQGTETYIDVNDVQQCKVASIDWGGRVVYLGLDLAMSNDNTSVSMVTLEDDVIFATYNNLFPSGKGKEHTNDIVMTIIKAHDSEEHIQKFLRRCLETDMDLSHIY